MSHEDARWAGVDEGVMVSGLVRRARVVDDHVAARPLLWVSAVLALTLLASGLCLVVGADLATAALALLAVVVVAGRYGFGAAALATGAGYLALNFWFTAPTGLLQVDKVEDLLPLLAFAVAGVASALAPALGAPRRDPRPIVAVVAVGAASALLVLADADLVVAALSLLGVVVVTAVLGAPAAATAVVGSYLALNYWFTPPIQSLEITKSQDLVPLVAFTIAAAASAVTVARVQWLSRRATIVEARAFNARIAQATSDSRAAFLASMTHNLRTPLATIKASVSTLLATPDGDLSQRITLLAHARAETERLERLVTKVLQMARIHSGALEPHPELVDLAEMSGGVARRLQHLASERGLHVAVHGELVFAAVDPDMLELILVVLLENAMRHAPAASEIEVRVDVGADGRACLRVVDHGPGIPVAQREAVFEEFVRLDPADGGSGLGLTIARSMVEAHDGSVSIEETPAGGATVVVALPAAVVPVTP